MTAHTQDLLDTSLDDLCDHIVDDHHALLRSELPRIEKLLAKVAGHHAAERPALTEVQRIFGELHRDLLDHIDREEERLFPTCRALEGGARFDGPPPTAATLRMHEKAHSNVHDKLAAIRELSDDYSLDQALCNGHRRLLESLGALESDLRQHIHEENDVLFPKLRQRFGLPAPTA